MKKLFIFFTLHFSLFTFLACNSIVEFDKDYTPAHDIANTGAPVITAVYNVTDTAQLNKLSQGEVGMMIKIVGKNLNNVRKVRFVTADESLSGEADLNQAYTYSTAANVVVPANIGQKALKLEYTTDMGTTNFDFVIPFPQLEVIDNQYMLQGNRLTVYGQYFDKYKGINATINGAPAQILETTENTLSVELGSNPSGSVVLNWTDGDGVQQTAKIALRPRENLLYGDFSGTQINNDGITYTIEDDSALPNASAQGGKHLHLTASLDAWAWKTLDLSQNIPFAVDAPENYVFVFEVLTPKEKPLIPSESGNELVLFQFNWAGMLSWAPGQGKGLDTKGQWMTVSQPLDGMNISAKDSWQALRMVLHPNTAWNADFRLANFRILKK